MIIEVAEGLVEAILNQLRCKVTGFLQSLVVARLDFEGGTPGSILRSPPRLQRMVGRVREPRVDYLQQGGPRRLFIDSASYFFRHDRDPAVVKLLVGVVVAANSSRLLVGHLRCRLKHGRERGGVEEGLQWMAHEAAREGWKGGST